ncbi:SNF1-interacting protein [Phytophthora pseudosyringae]|uniref:SNF1-interacting protein n=1 Tax=Phytophthora pseudosyringae TaxID=221518 RepID=A0A8T1WCR5_9STRA|nr:SNF1-interacting protein [Phytophthora pseudosyringae]
MCCTQRTSRTNETDRCPRGSLGKPSRREEAFSMGNSTSKKSGAVNSRRHSDSSRELEKYTQPTGLYASCPWELKTARRLILERKLAPRVPGKEAKEGGFTLECPICFMFYPGSVNMSSCCNKPICSECYLQIRPPQKSICCPFCNHEAFSVRYTPPSPAELTSIRSMKNLRSPRRSSAIGIPKQPATSSPQTAGSRSQSVQYASVEDRHRIRDSLRSQLSISDKPVTNSPHPNSVAALNDAASHLLATPADAARLEELMLLEAIRRSMQDLHVGKDGEELGGSQSSQQPTRGSGENGEDDDSDVDYADVAPLSASQITVSASGAVHYSSLNQADSSQHTARNSDMLPPRSSTTQSWNPFDD